MMKIRKDSYLAVFSLRIALFIISGGALTAMMIVALTYLPSAGNLWLALMIALGVLFFGPWFVGIQPVARLSWRPARRQYRNHMSSESRHFQSLSITILAIATARHRFWTFRR